MTGVWAAVACACLAAERVRMPSRIGGAAIVVAGENATGGTRRVASRAFLLGGSVVVDLRSLSP